MQSSWQVEVSEYLDQCPLMFGIQMLLQTALIFELFATPGHGTLRHGPVRTCVCLHVSSVLFLDHAHCVDAMQALTQAADLLFRVF